MRTRIARALAAVLCLAALTSSPQPSLVQSNGDLSDRLGVDFGLVEIPGTPGRTAIDRVRVINKTSSEMTVSSFVEDLGADADGDVVAVPRGTGRSSAASWVTVEPPTLKIGANSSTIATVRISVPQGVKPRGYYAAVTFDTDAGAPPEERVVHGLLVKVAGSGATATPELVSVAMPGVATRGRVPVSVTIENTGNLHAIGTGSVLVTDTFGGRVARLRFPAVVLPGIQRVVTVTLDSPPVVGRLKAAATLEFGGEPLRGDASGYVLVWWLAIAFALVVALFLLALVRVAGLAGPKARARRARVVDARPAAGTTASGPVPVGTGAAAGAATATVAAPPKQSRKSKRAARARETASVAPASPAAGTSATPGPVVAGPASVVAGASKPPAPIRPAPPPRVAGQADFGPDPDRAFWDDDDDDRSGFEPPSRAPSADDEAIESRAPAPVRPVALPLDVRDDDDEFEPLDEERSDDEPFGDEEANVDADLEDADEDADDDDAAAADDVDDEDSVDEGEPRDEDDGDEDGDDVDAAWPGAAPSPAATPPAPRRPVPVVRPAPAPLRPAATVKSAESGEEPPRPTAPAPGSMPPPLIRPAGRVPRPIHVANLPPLREAPPVPEAAWSAPQPPEVKLERAGSGSAIALRRAEVALRMVGGKPGETGAILDAGLDLLYSVRSDPSVVEHVESVYRSTRNRRKLGPLALALFAVDSREAPRALLDAYGTASKVVADRIRRAILACDPADIRPHRSLIEALPQGRRDALGL